MCKKFFIVLLSMVLIALIIPLKASAQEQEWVSFTQTVIPEKPSYTLLKSDDQETVIKFTIPGMMVKDITEGRETFKSLRFSDYYLESRVLGDKSNNMYTQYIFLS